MVAPNHNRESFAHCIPKDPVANMDQRKKFYEVLDRPRRELLWKMCSRDILFWINAFVWTFDPRLVDGGQDPEGPFISYEFQDELFLAIEAALGREDIEVKKSRDLGLTWIFLIVFTHQFIFRRNRSFLCVSRTERMVDKTQDPDCLFWKIDWILDHLPYWMRPNLRPGIDRLNLHFHNPERNNTIDGAATTGNMARGGRRTGIGMDEFAAFEVDDGYKALAATQKATRCRIMVSTPQGVGNAFYDTWQLDIKKLEPMWWDHPVQNQGLYTSSDGVLEVIDHKFWDRATVGKVDRIAPLIKLDALPNSLARDHYPFITDGKLRAPYYDNECKRTPLESQIAQELDAQFHGSGKPFFSAEEVQRLAAQYGRPALRVGDLTFDTGDSTPLLWKETEQAVIKLWTVLGHEDKPPDDRNYVMGIDISTGTGASNSAIAIYDTTTYTKVATLINPNIGSHRLAGYAVALARWFKGQDGEGAHMIWEANGPGREFGPRVIDLGYRNFYYRTQEQSIAKTVSKLPGWWTGRENKSTLLREYGRALAAGDLINRDVDAIKEMGNFKYVTGGDVEHVRSISSQDPSGAKQNHGDIVIADALAWWVMKEPRHQEEPEPVIPDRCLFRRMEKVREAEGARQEIWV